MSCLNQTLMLHLSSFHQRLGMPSECWHGMLNVHVHMASAIAALSGSQDHASSSAQPGKQKHPHPFSSLLFRLQAGQAAHLAISEPCCIGDASTRQLLGSKQTFRHTPPPPPSPPFRPGQGLMEPELHRKGMINGQKSLIFLGGTLHSCRLHQYRHSHQLHLQPLPSPI